MTTLARSDHVVVVGAGLAGWRFVEAVRRDGYEGTLTLVGDEPYAPYDRPPLSKQVLAGKWGVEHTTLATPELVEKNEVTLLLGVGASDLDVAVTTVHLNDGTVVAGTHVVIATGARARVLPFSAGDELHTLRRRDDVERLRSSMASLPEGCTVVVIGGGFIGAEAATSMRANGLTPLVLEAAERPLVNVLGPDVSTWLESLASDAGIELRNNQQISDVEHDGENFIVRFGDGGELRTPLVLVGAGAVTNAEWLASSGLLIDNGVVVDSNLLATERVGAIGDVARFNWASAAGPELVRIEHWQVANDHAAHLAQHWTKGGDTARMVPYFWSDQYGKKIQMLGHPRPTDEARLVNGGLDEGRWTALYSREGVVTGVVALGQPRALMLSKGLLDSATSLDDAIAMAPWAS